MKSSLQVDKLSATPVYVQLTEQIHLLIHRGKLSPGSRMPTVRALAVELGVNANTVARVYRDLQNRGYLRLERGVGTFVAPEVREEQLARQEFKKIRSKAKHLASLCRRVGLSFGEFSQLMERLWKEVDNDEG